MLKQMDRPIRTGWRGAVQSLPGKLLLLTISFVMTSVALIYFPTVARYHHELIFERIESARLLILPFTEAPGDQLSMALRTEMLEAAGLEAVILRDHGRQALYSVGAEPPEVQAIFDAGETDLLEQIEDVVSCLFAPPGRIIRVDYASGLGEGMNLVAIADEDPIRAALFIFSTRVLVLSIFISIFTSLLVFFSVYFMLVRPMQRITSAMTAFRENPEDASRIMQPSARKDEIGTAEHELSTLQRELYGFLQQKTRLAALGLAVAKIQHDLRNILSTAQIASDRLSHSTDPVVQRVTPRLVGALDRAIALATNTLRYGRAEERAPQRTWLSLAPLVDEAAASALPEGGDLAFENRVPRNLQVDADSEHLFRAILNLLRNAREALEGVPESERLDKLITVEAHRRNETVIIEIADSGPGIALAARERLFQPFAGSARAGGSGLGLAISRELMLAHGGDLSLLSTGEMGTRFRLVIPDRKTS